MGKMEHCSLQSVALILQLQYQDPLFHCPGLIFFLSIRLQHKTVSNPGQVDGQRIPLVGRDQTELIVLGRILQLIGNTAPVMRNTVMPLKLDAQPSLMPNGREDTPKALNISGILKGVAIVIAVKIDKGIRIRRMSSVGA